MERDSIKHSAEGTHWQKKNHKYIRKEGNRYIYPSDLKRLENTAEKRQNAVNNQGSTDYKKIGSDRAKRRRAAGVPDELIVKNYRQAYPEQYAKEVSRHKKNYRKAVESTNELKKSNTTYQQNSQDYKKLSKQKANRTAAASGKVVNPSYVIKGSDGKVIGRGSTNRNYDLPTTADYKEYSQLTAGHKNRRKNLSKQGSTDYKELSKQQVQKTNRANAANGARGTFEKGHMSDQDYQKKYYERQVIANRRKRAAGSGQNKGQTYAKNTAHEGKFRAERLLAEKEQRRKKRVNEAVMELTAENAKNSEINKMVKTPKDYENTFRSKVAKKKVNRGRQIVDKILSKFRKKK